jgi:hypothetical protein
MAKRTQPAEAQIEFRIGINLGDIIVDDNDIRQWPATLEKYVYPLLGKLPFDRIDTALVLKVLQPIWTEHPETASRVRGRIESVLDWAAARGYRHGDNPARWRGHLRNLLPATSRLRRIVHHPALPYPSIGAFMKELRQQEGIAARALEFLILTAARSGAGRGAVWRNSTSPIGYG